MDSGDAIFLLNAHDQLDRVDLTSYDSEDVLQELIARYPELLVGEQLDPDDPPRWMLVTREAAVSDGMSTSRWSADHLLLDQRSVPTIVEVKRSTDTRIRREIVGQMLDYAANATKYWPVDQLRLYALKHYGDEAALDKRVRELVDQGDSLLDDVVERYWQEVGKNLQKGHLRLLFVSDSLPPELRRIIEFLNEHLSDIEVLGVEIAMYQKAGMRALVPRVIGRLERISDEKENKGPKILTTEAQFLSANPLWAQEFFRALFAEASSRALVVSWGTKGFSIRAHRPSGKLVSVLTGYPPGALGSDVPFLEIILDGLAPSEQPELVRGSALAIPGFNAKGQHSIRFDLSRETMPLAQSALPAVWAAYRRIAGATPP